MGKKIGRSVEEKYHSWQFNKSHYVVKIEKFDLCLYYAASSVLYADKLNSRVHISIHSIGKWPVPWDTYNTYAIIQDHKLKKSFFTRLHAQL